MPPGVQGDDTPSGWSGTKTTIDKPIRGQVRRQRKLLEVIKMTQSKRDDCYIRKDKVFYKKTVFKVAPGYGISLVVMLT